MTEEMTHTFEMTCPKCGKELVISEHRDDQLVRTQAYAYCPICQSVVFVKSMAGYYKTEIKK